MAVHTALRALVSKHPRIFPHPVRVAPYPDHLLWGPPVALVCPPIHSVWAGRCPHLTPGTGLAWNLR